VHRGARVAFRPGSLTDEVSIVPLVLGHAGGGLLLARAVFVGLLVIALLTDLRARRIPNVLTVTLAAAGLIAAAFGVGSPSGLLGALGALAAGFAIWLPVYVLGAVGAGDVKLFAAASAWLTPGGACWAAFAGALAGAAVGVATYVWSHGLSMTAFRLGSALREPRTLTEPLPSARGRDARVPYGVSLVAGLLLQAFVPNWHLWVN
jgi:prepilin peptidase CpaA